MQKPNPIPVQAEPHEVVRIACHVVCDRRTVVSYLAGRRVSSTMRARIESALRTLGLERLLVVTPAGQVQPD